MSECVCVCVCVRACVRACVCVCDDVFEICGSFRYKTHRSEVIECKGLEIQPIRAEELECLMANQSRSPGMQRVAP